MGRALDAINFVPVDDEDVLSIVRIKVEIGLVQFLHFAGNAVSVLEDQDVFSSQEICRKTPAGNCQDHCRE